MKKMIFVAVMLVLFFVGLSCDGDPKALEQKLQSMSKYNNQPSTKKEDMKTICLDGVTYYYFILGLHSGSPSFMSVKFNRDGTVNTCGEDVAAANPIPLPGK